MAVTGENYTTAKRRLEEMPPPPDKYCVTLPDGDCVSKDPRCMHQPKP
jgi:hypothetical protein